MEHKKISASETSLLDTHNGRKGADLIFTAILLTFSLSIWSILCVSAHGPDSEL